jgi:DNA polymerase delta subunit 3
VKKSRSGPTQVPSRSPLDKKSSSSSQVGKKTNQKSFFSPKAKEILVNETVLKASTRPNDLNTDKTEQPKDEEKKERKPLKIVKIDSSKQKVHETKKQDVDIPLVPKEPMIVSKQSAAQADQIKQLFENDEDSDVSEEKSVAPTAQEMETRRVRKKRKIVRSKTFMEGKYMVTKDVEEWESYSEDETVPIGKSASKMIKIDPSAKGAKNQQRSIMSYFQKK